MVGSVGSVCNIVVDSVVVCSVVVGSVVVCNIVVDSVVVCRFCCGRFSSSCL